MKDFLHGNDFQHTRVRENDVTRMVLRIQCSHCDNQLDLPLKHTTCEQQFADRMFRNKHWLVGRSRSEDVCPDCVKAEKAVKQAERALTLAQTITEIPEDSSETGFIAEFIKERLQPTSTGLLGYMPGWSDRSVAEHLKSLIPKIDYRMVAALRVEKFGRARAERTKPIQDVQSEPTPKNIVIQDNAVPDYNDLMEIINDLRDELDQVRTRLHNAEKAMQTLVARSNDLQESLEKLEEEFDTPVAVSPRTVAKMFGGAKVRVHG